MPEIPGRLLHFMLEKADHDNPFLLYKNLYYHDYLTTKDGRDILGIPDEEPLLDSIYEVTTSYDKKPEKLDTFNLKDIGVSTLMLYRIRYYLGAKITKITEIEKNRFFCIDICKADGSEASIHYASCSFGGDQSDKALLQTVALHTKEKLGGISSVLIRGFSDFFRGDLVGECRNAIASDARALVQGSKNRFAKIGYVVCTVDGDTLPSLFTENGRVLQAIGLNNKTFEYGEEIVLIGDAQCFEVGAAKEEFAHAVLPVGPSSVNPTSSREDEKVADNDDSEPESNSCQVELRTPQYATFFAEASAAAVVGAAVVSAAVVVRV
jgi:hypothetical protein